MNIKLLFDSHAIHPHFKTGWGFSCLVNDAILFDVGKSSKALRHNLHLMAIDPTSIKSIIISHDHHDHAGALNKLLTFADPESIYLCPHSRISITSNKIIFVSPFCVIDKQVFSSGELVGLYNKQLIVEQVLILKGTRGLTILTGCAHPSVTTIVTVVKTHFPHDPIDLLIGGFHLYRKNQMEIENFIRTLQSLQVKRIAPLHCSGTLAKKLFKKHYQENCLELKVGETITL